MAASRQLVDRRDDESAFVLHVYPYRETSLIVEAFTAAAGRVAMVARGARRPRSDVRGLLNAFVPLTLSWAGGGELKTLLKAEWRGGLALPSGSALLCGFYLNELLLKLLPREDAHPALWAHYEAALVALTERTPADQAAILRRFELALLAELGYAMPLTRASDGTDVRAAERYHYAFERGPLTAAEPGARYPIVRGETLLALASERYPDARVAAEARELMCTVLDHYLDARPIVSRRVVRDLQALDEESEA